MQFTTRMNITILFAVIVSVLIVLLNMLIFESANTEWQSKKTAYMHHTMDSMLTLDEAKKMFSNLQVESSTGAIIYQQGIFTHAMEHKSLASWYFGDTNITMADGRAYYWGIESKGDGYTYKTVDDVTDILMTRDMIVERSLRLSILGFLMIVLIGYFFSGYLLRPIQNMNEATRRFSLSEKSTDHHVGIYGNIKDEVVILARSLEELFARVNKEAERLEQFSDDIAHEIKNKLFEILSSLDIAENPLHTRYGITKAKRILKQLSSVVDALLFFARNDIRESKKMDISKLIRDSFGQDDPRVEIISHAQVMLPIHEELFVTAVGNIVSNAQKFTNEIGKITILVEKNRLSVTDTGPGIPKKDLPHIFDRLYKVDRARTMGTGHGLGLAISKKILEELHHMKLSVDSTLGKGTTFTIDWGNTNKV